MFDELKDAAQSMMGGKADPQAVADAADDHVGSMDAGELQDHLQTAADNARQNGNDDMAGEIEQMVQNGQADPDQLKSMAVRYIRENPDVLQHFAPPFVQGILSKFTG